MDKYIIYELEQLEKITGYSLQHIKNDINDVYNKLEEKDKEIERLSNIINELEKDFKDKGLWYSLQKVQELKEGK